MSTPIVAPHPTPNGNGNGDRTRGTGRVYVRPGSKWLWIQWYARGTMHRESTKTTDPKKAEKKLRTRLSLADKGDDSTAVRKAEGVTFENLMEGLVKHYNRLHQRSLDTMGVSLAGTASGTQARPRGSRPRSPRRRPSATRPPRG